jgi:hypothetical protein
MSVLDMRRLEFDAIGCRPPGNDVGGTGKGRGVAAFRNKATVGNADREREKRKETMETIDGRRDVPVAKLNPY